MEDPVQRASLRNIRFSMKKKEQLIDQGYKVCKCASQHIIVLILRF